MIAEDALRIGPLPFFLSCGGYGLAFELLNASNGYTLY